MVRQRKEKKVPGKISIIIMGGRNGFHLFGEQKGRNRPAMKKPDLWGDPAFAGK